MSAWTISLPAIIGIVMTVALMITVALGSYTVVRQFAADKNDESAQKVADHVRRVIGVLLGLMLSTVFAFSSNRALKIQDSVEVEAAQLRDLHNDLARFKSDAADAAERQILQYIETVVQDEWPTLAKGKDSRKADQLFLSIEDKLLALPIDTETEKELKSRLLEDIDEISDLRQARVYSAGSGLDWYIFLVVLSFALLMTTFRFYAPSRWTRFFLIAYAVLIGIVLYSTVAQNYPFRSGRVSPQPFEKLGTLIKESETP